MVGASHRIHQDALLSESLHWSKSSKQDGRAPLDYANVVTQTTRENFRIRVFTNRPDYLFKNPNSLRIGTCKVRQSGRRAGGSQDWIFRSLQNLQHYLFKPQAHQSPTLAGFSHLA
jgi:hypothetical protein